MGQNRNLEKKCPIAEFSTLFTIFSGNSFLKAMGQNILILRVKNNPKSKIKILSCF